jgi:pimeloyl-ACP methyl ester carboxylesterase
MTAKGKPGSLLASATALLGAFGPGQLIGSNRSSEDSGYDDAFETRVESFETEDGVTLKLKRYVSGGAQPVLLVHGFLANGSCFDLPHKGHNLAIYLAERGYDVWVASFRGCGQGPYRCRIDDWSHSLDHLAAFDAPALVDGIMGETGKRPVWIGHSMGGMVLYMYLQGPAIRPDRHGFRVVCDAERAAARNRSVLGGVTIGSPPAFHFGGKDWMEALTRLPLFGTLTGWMIHYFRWAGSFFPRVGLPGMPELADSFPRIARMLAAKGPVASSFYNIENVDPEVGYSFFKWAGDSVSSRMTTQILRFAQESDLKDYNGGHNYTENMDGITAPLFFISGSEDFAGPENIRVYGYEKVASEIKQFKLYQDYGHTDLVLGKRVAEEVFPDILSWLRRLEQCAFGTGEPEA